MKDMAYLKRKFEEITGLKYNDLFVTIKQPIAERKTQEEKVEEFDLRKDKVKKISEKMQKVADENFCGQCPRDKSQKNIKEATDGLLEIIDILGKRPFSKPNDNFVTIVKKNTVEDKYFKKYISTVNNQSDKYNGNIQEMESYLNTLCERLCEFLKQESSNKTLINIIVNSIKSSTNLKLAVVCYLIGMINALLSREESYRGYLMGKKLEIIKQCNLRRQDDDLEELIGKLRDRANIKRDKEEVTFFYNAPYGAEEHMKNDPIWYGDGTEYITDGITLLFPNVYDYKAKIYLKKENIESYKKGIKSIFLEKDNWKKLENPNQIKLKEEKELKKENKVLKLKNLDEYCNQVFTILTTNAEPNEKTPETAAPLPEPITSLPQGKTPTPKKGVPSHKLSSVQKVTKHVSEAGTQAKKTLRGVGNEVQETLREVSGDVKYTTEKTVDAGKRAISKLGDAATKAGGALKDFLGRFRKGKK